jgi:hypothetical protein
MRFLKEIRVPSQAEQLENELKPFVAVWYGDGGEHSHNVEERIDRAEAERLLKLHDEGKI